MNPDHILRVNIADEGGPHVVFITDIFIVLIVLATIPRRPLPDGCTHAAMTSPICTMNCCECGIEKLMLR